MTECSTKEVGIDIETRSSADLVKYGVYAYTDSPDFEILLIAYTTDAGVELIDLKQGNDPTDFLNILKNPKIIKTAYNANFERTCLARYFGIACPPEEWRCTAVLASQLGLPRSLQKVGEAIGLPEEEKKLKTGKALISYFCKPQRPTKSNGGRIWNDPCHDQDKWELFKTYCKQDVVTEQAIRQKLIRFAPNEAEQELWNLDQRINDRGVRIDLDLADIVVRETAIRSKVLEVKARELSGLENPNSLVLVKAWLKSYGIEVDSLNKDALKELLKQELPSNVREFLKIRQVLGLSSVKKYQTMQAMTCKDGYCRGMMQFYGGHTGRWAGRGLQPQNLTKNEVTLKELDIARKLVKADDMEGLELLFDEPTQMFKQLVRTAFIPSEGRRFIVTDFAAIEARVIAALASEDNWRLEAFRRGDDIYCESASRMFGVPVVKHGINGHLRAQGKVAELACIAEGQLVLTDQGEVPIEKVTTDMRVWDGYEWVKHDGVVFNGYKEVITYDGLTATRDHQVFTEVGEAGVPFFYAARTGAHLVQSGDRGKAIRVGGDHKPGEAMEQELEPLSSTSAMLRMWNDQVDLSEQLAKRKEQGLSSVLTAEADTPLVRQETDRRKAEMREPKGPGVQKLWGEGYPLRLSECDGSRPLSDRNVQELGQIAPTGPDRQQRQLCSGKLENGAEVNQSSKQADNSVERVRSEILAIRGDSCQEEACCGLNEGRDHRRCRDSCLRQAEELEGYSRKARVYDIRNAGNTHRYTVSGKLVHNCGYGGGVGAIKSMDKDGAIPEDKIGGIVSDWRDASPFIVKLWYKVEECAIKAVQTRAKQVYRGLVFKSGKIAGFDCLRVKLLSGRCITYFDVKLIDGKYGPSLTYMHSNQTTGKWERTETYGGKIVENCIAEDTPVLTDSGWKPIQNIGSTDKVWDGVKWVRHEGLISRGVQNVISVDGVEMTPDHKVLTEEGWKNASSCEGYNRRETVLPNSYLLCRLRRKEKHMEHKMRLRKAVHDARIRMEKRQAEVLRLYDQALNITSQIYTRNVENADLQRLALNEGALRVSDGAGMAQLWRQRYQGLQRMVGELRSLLSRYGSYLQAWAYTRQNRCERRLRTGQLPLDNSEGAVPEQALQPLYRYTLGQDNDSGSLRAFRYRRHHSMLQTKQRHRRRLAVRKTGHKKQVYDIKNSGDLHRFTVLGENGALIVHNCVQSIARDCLAEKMKIIAGMGYDIAFHVHDEMIVDAPIEDDKAFKLIDDVMAEPIAWMPNLPLKGSTYACEYYVKD